MNDTKTKVKTDVERRMIT